MRTIPVPYVNTRKAEELFRHRVLRLLKDKGLLSEERIQLLLSWRRSGFSIDDSVRIPAGQQRAIEHVARYMLRAPLSLSRMRWSRDDSEVFYIAKGSQDDPEAPSARARRIDTLEFVCGGQPFAAAPQHLIPSKQPQSGRLARVIAQIPQPRRHLLFYYRRYSHVVRGKRRKFSSISRSETDIHELHLLLSRSRYLELLPRGEIDSVRVSGRAEPARKPWSTPPAFPR